MTRISITDRRRKKPVRADYWVAQWPTDGGPAKQRKFSIRKHGERGAYLKALRTRQAALGTLSS